MSDLSYRAYLTTLCPADLEETFVAEWDPREMIDWLVENDPPGADNDAYRDWKLDHQDDHLNP